jgi:hypothetical protein
MTEPLELPPLPAPELSGFPKDDPDEFAAFSSDQLNAFARAAQAIALERAAQIADAPTIVAMADGDNESAELMSDLIRMYLGGAAAAIRALKERL